MKCPYCREDIDSNIDICPVCGEKMPAYCRLIDLCKNHKDNLSSIFKNFTVITLHLYLVLMTFFVIRFVQLADGYQNSTSFFYHLILYILFYFIPPIILVVSYWINWFRLKKNLFSLPHDIFLIIVLHFLTIFALVGIFLVFGASYNIIESYVYDDYCWQYIAFLIISCLPIVLTAYYWFFIKKRK